MNAVAGWVAPVATTIAAMMTAANLGARVTGWGFVVFLVGSLAWVVVALSTGQPNLLWANGFLTLVNLVGVWRWLGRQARYEDGGQRATQRSAAARVPTLFAMGAIVGGKLTGPDGQTVAVIVDGMMRCSDAGLAYLVVSEGGVGGVGERLHALGPAEIQFSEDGASCSLTSDALKARTPLQPDAWPASIDRRA
jgi:hypothetical protein